MSKVPIKVLLDETMAPFMPFITTSAVQLQDGEHSLEDLETAVANSIITGSYNNLNKKIILTAQNGHTVEFSIADIIYGLQSEITNQNKLSSDLVDDSNHTNKFVSASDKTAWNGKQDALVSGTNIKTINNQSILGSGNISISEGGGTSDYTNLENKPSINNVTLSGNKSSSDLSLQETLVSGTNIKTINNESILGSGNVSISGGQTIQYDIMPIASASNLGQIVQYTGTTTTTAPIYTNGYFYECVEDDGVYSWENVKVQPVESLPQLINGILYVDLSTYAMPTSANNNIASALQTALTDYRTSIPNITQLVIKYSNGTLTYDFVRYIIAGDGAMFVQSFKDDMCNTETDIYSGCSWFRIDYIYQWRVFMYYQTNKVLQRINKQTENLAPVYNSSSTYAVGDYVSYQGKLYKCNTAISSAEAWTVAHWTETTVMAELGNISTVLSSLVTVGGNQ